MIGRGYVGHYSEHALSSALSVCFTFVAVVLREYGLVSCATVDFRLFYDGATGVRMWAFPTNGRCGFFDAHMAH